MIVFVLAVPTDRAENLEAHVTEWLKSAPGTEWRPVEPNVSVPTEPWPEPPAVADATKVWSALGDAERKLLDRLQSTTVKYERGNRKTFRAEAEAEQLAIMCGATGPIEIAQTAEAIEQACREVGRESCLEVRFVDDIAATTILFKEPARKAFLRLR